MIIICPECATRYLIDPRALGVMGRSVRCTQCSHVWMQLPPEDAPRRVDLPLPGTEKPQAARPAPQARALPPPPQSAPPAPPKAAPAPPKVAAPPPVPAYADAADNTVARGGSRPLVIALVAIAILGGLWYGRDFLLDRVPALEGVYALFGVGPGDPSSDLEFSGVTSNRRQENGRATLVIDGQVTNVSQAARRVPPVRITLEDSGRHPIKSWTVVATSDRLPPGGSAPFHTSVADPGSGTVGATVSFDSGTD